jgi:integrase
VFGARAVVSFARAALSYLEFEARSPRTVIDVNRLAQHFGATRLALIDQDAADGAVKALLDLDAKPATKIRTVYMPLTAVLNHAAARKWCDHPKFERPTVETSKTRWLTPAEAIALIDCAADHLRPLLTFILCTGARLSEALELDWANVDLPAGLAHFRDTKNEDDRAAALPPAAILALANLLGRKLPDGTHEKKGPVFLRDDGEPYADRGRLEGGQIGTAWATACKRAGLPGKLKIVERKIKMRARWIAVGRGPAMRHKLRPEYQRTVKLEVFTPQVTPHDLRHTWATWFYALTKDPLLLKAEGGWKSLKMVERYAHLMPSALVPEIARVWGNSHPRIGTLPDRANLAHPALAAPKSA